MTLSHLHEALSETCTIERGTIFAPVTLPGVACLACPPMDVRDTASLRLLLLDAERILQPGWRVVYGGRRFVIVKLAVDPDGLTEAELKDFNEPA